MILLLLLLALPGGRGRAALEVVDVPVWVEIRNGGTAVITPEGNSSLPAPSRLTLGANRSEAFHILCTCVGNFTYTVRVEPDERALDFDATEYRTTLSVTEEDRALHVGVVVYTAGEDGKADPDFSPRCVLASNSNVSQDRVQNPTVKRKTEGPGKTERSG